MIVIDRSATWLHELAWLVTERAKLGHERAIFGREYLHPLVESIGDEQEISMIRTQVRVACRTGYPRPVGRCQART